MEKAADGRRDGQSRTHDPVEYIVAVADDDHEMALTDVIDARHRPR